MTTAKVSAGFKETKEALLFLILLGKAIEKSLSDDGQVSVGDLPNFFFILKEIGPAFEGVDKLPLELKMASQEEYEELKAFIKSELDLEDDKVEAIVKDSFAIIVDLWIFLQKYIIKNDTTEVSENSDGTDESTDSGNAAPPETEEAK